MDVCLALIKGVNKIDPDLIWRIINTYNVPVAKNFSLRVPVEKHITVELKLRINKDVDQVLVNDKKYFITLGEVEACYQDLEAARRAFPDWEKIYYERTM